MKKLFLTLITALSLTSTQAFPTHLPDGLVDAFTRPNPAWPAHVTLFQVADLGDGNCLITFCVQGQGRWALYEITPDCPQLLLMAGKATVKDDIQYCIVPISSYVGCFINIENVHGWAGPEL